MHIISLRPFDKGKNLWCAGGISLTELNVAGSNPTGALRVSGMIPHTDFMLVLLRSVQTAVLILNLHVVALLWS